MSERVVKVEGYREVKVEVTSATRLLGAIAILREVASREWLLPSLPCVHPL
jgi:hypothetical protein